MKKYDVRAIFLVVIILLLISAISIFGITVYIDIMRQQKDKEYEAFEGNTTTMTTENESNTIVVMPSENEINNQNTVSNNENQNVETNVPVSNEVQNTSTNTPTTNETQNIQSNTTAINNIQSTPSSTPSKNETQNTQTSNSSQNTQTNNPASNEVQNTPTYEAVVKQEYYYNQLNSYAKLIYNGLKNNKDNLKTGTYKIDFGEQFSTLLSQENGTQLMQEYYQSAMETYLYDNPDVFYLEPTKMYVNIETTKKVFSTTYKVSIDCGENANYLANGYTSKQQILECESKINQEVQKILQKTTGKSNYQKIKIIHDYLVDNISYEETISKANIYNIYGALVNKECVCEGYAKAFKYLMSKINVDSIVLIGNATDSNGKTQKHAWNYIKFNNKWYAVDVTWDDPIIIGGGTLSQKNKYKYFLKGSETINKDHTASYTFVENGQKYTHPTLSIKDYE